VTPLEQAEISVLSTVSPVHFVFKLGFSDHNRATAWGKTPASRSASAVLQPALLAREQQERPIFMGRPFPRLAMPISLFYPDFSQIQEELQSLDSRTRDPTQVGCTAKLFAVMQQADEFADDDSFHKACSPIIRQLLDIGDDEFRLNVVHYKNSRRAVECNSLVYFPTPGGRGSSKWFCIS
jgi:hypothetical protein